MGRRNKALKETDANLSGDHIREGLCGVISIKVEPKPHTQMSILATPDAPTFCM